MSTDPSSAPASPSRKRALLPKKATDICATLGVNVDASPLLREGMTPEQFLAALLEQAEYVEAVTFMSCALPKREAIWWACLCARRSAEADLSGADKSALNAAVRWIKEPNDEHRRAAMTAAEATGYASPAGLAALGAFFSGGSMSPPDLPPAEPEEHLTARSVCGAVMLAAVMREPEKAPENYRRFLDAGIDVAHRRLHWDQKPKEN